MPNNNRTSVNTTAALVVVAIVFVVTVIAVLLAFLFAPAERDLTIVVGPLLGTLAPTIAAVALLVQVKNVQADVSQVRADTHALTNGLLDSKVRAGVADVIRDEHLDPEAVALIKDDRQVRDRAHGDGGEA